MANLIKYIACFSLFIPGGGGISLAAGKGATSPEAIKWSLVKSYPHDKEAFTQGLEVWDGRHFLESTGQYGRSEVRRVEISTGKVVASTLLDPKYFGEGIVRLGGDIYQLTWREGQVLKWTFQGKKGFEQKGTALWSGEGWGATKGPSGSIWASNGTDKLSEVDPKTFKVKRTLKVTLSGQAMDRINELEFVGGKIFANVWMTTMIVRIDPKSGVIDGIMDMSSLVPAGLPQDAVLNGIAWDEGKKRLYVTGKLWPKVFELELGR